jgi:hypothetical protein
VDTIPGSASPDTSPLLPHRSFGKLPDDVPVADGEAAAVLCAQVRLDLIYVIYVTLCMNKSIKQTNKQTNKQTHTHIQHPSEPPPQPKSKHT